MNNPYETDILNSLEVFRQHGVILYPTDTVWGLGCNAHDERAIEKVFEIKRRPKNKSLVLLMRDAKQLMHYIANPPLDLESVLAQFNEPTTIVYPNAINLPDALMAEDGSIAIRISKDPFCRSLIKRMRAPLVSTSANISGEIASGVFKNISSQIKEAVDYVVKWRQEEVDEKTASAILKLEGDGTFLKLR